MKEKQKRSFEKPIVITKQSGLEVVANCAGDCAGSGGSNLSIAVNAISIHHGQGNP